MHCLHQRLDLTRQLVELVELRAEDLDGQITADTDDHFGHSHVDRLREAVADARHLVEHLADPGGQCFLVGQLPLRTRLENEEGVGLVQAHGVEPDFVGASSCHHAGDLGDLAHQGLVDLQVQRGSFFQTHRRQLLDAHDDVSLVHRRQEGLTHLGVDAGRHREHQTGDDEHDALVAQRPAQNRFVELQQLARQPRVFMCRLFQQERRQYRNHRERQYERADQREDDGHRHGDEVLAFQILQG